MKLIVKEIDVQAAINNLVKHKVIMMFDSEHTKKGARKLSREAIGEMLVIIPIQKSNGKGVWKTSKEKSGSIKIKTICSEWSNGKWLVYNRISEKSHQSAFIHPEVLNALAFLKAYSDNIDLLEVAA